ncbi:beta-lactamase-like protein [Hysterangium stoloniferum]|nr:beta-lactamase-like protein [Hysterangium stoloniferum]
MGSETAKSDLQLEYQFIFHGTGNSGSIPSIECLTASKNSKFCETCQSAITPEGKKNLRRNTGGILHVTQPNGEKGTIVIDVGKNFLSSAVEWFPKYGLRKIDGVLITHPHADAMNGLDDLRGWTSAIQSYIDVYVSRDTFLQVQRAFPYLVSKEFASGGGDVAQFKWHIIEPNQRFTIGNTGVEVTPFLVHHGRLFTNGQPPPEWLPTPDSSHPTTPTSHPNPLPNGGSLQPSPALVHPYYCLGFVIRDIVYISDVSYIPETAWSVIETARRRPYSVFIVDCLKLIPHISHFGLAQAVTAARRLGGMELNTYLVGFSHDISHATWEKIGRILERSEDDNGEELDEVTKSALLLVPKGPALRIRPAHDGLRLCFGKDGDIWEDNA